MTQPARGLDLQVQASLQASLDGLTAEVRRQNDYNARLNQALTVNPDITVPSITTASGNADWPELCGPRAGWVWDVRRITLGTFTAGSVNVCLDNSAGDVLVPFAQSGTETFGTGQILLTAPHRLVFAAQSVTGNVTINFAVIEIREDFLGAYLL